MDIHFHAGSPEELQLTADFLTGLAVIRSKQIADAQANWGQTGFMAGNASNLNTSLSAIGVPQYQAAAQSALSQDVSNVKPAKDTGKPGKAGKEPKPNPTTAAAGSSDAPDQTQAAAQLQASPSVSTAPSVEDVRKKISALTDGEDTRKALSATMKERFHVTSLIDLPADQRVSFLDAAKAIAEKAGLAWTE